MNVCYRSQCKRGIAPVIGCLLALCITAGKATAQGKFAGSFKTLIGQSYTRTDDLKSLKGWQFREGNLISELNDPERFAVTVYQKGTTALVFFGYMEDTASHVYVIADVIQVNNVTKGWEVRTALCRKYQIQLVEMVALVKMAKGEFATNVKQAWRFDRAKKRIDAVSVKGVDCMNEGED